MMPGFLFSRSFKKRYEVRKALRTKKLSTETVAFRITPNVHRVFQFRISSTFSEKRQKLKVSKYGKLNNTTRNKTLTSS